MSLWQWFGRKISFNKRKKTEIVADETSGYPDVVSDLDKHTLEEGLWILVLACSLAVLLIPLFFLIPKLYDFAQATSWAVIEDIDVTGDVGRAGDVVLDSSNLPRVVYFDNTNADIKYSARSSGGTWTTEIVDDATPYGSGTPENLKFSIAMDPTDSKPTVAYCKYIAAATSQLRIAHRPGDGSGNCGTSNNWTCSTVAVIDSCESRMISLAFHATSSQPTLSYGVASLVRYAEYNGSTWTITSPVNFNEGFEYFRHTATHGFTTSNEPIIFYSSSNLDTEQYLKYTYRKASDWTWQTPIEIDRWRNVPADVIVSAVDVARDASGYFYVSYNHYNDGIKFAKLSGITLTTSTIDTAVSSTWNSIALTSGNNPRIAYYDSTNLDLKYASYNGASWSTETASSTNNVGKYNSLKLLSDEPIITYADTTNLNMSMITGVSFNSAPSAPTTLYTNSSTAQLGQTDPINMATGSPAFSALYIDADTSDIANKVQLQLTTSTDGFATITHWDTGSSGTTIANVAQGARSANIFYDNLGTAATKAIGMPDDGTEGGINSSYYWRVRFWDTAGVSGAWSATSTFSIMDRPIAPSAVYATFTQTTSTITWTDNSSIENHVQVLYSTDGSSYSYHASSTGVSINTTSTSGLTPNTLYYFKTRAYNYAAFSADSSATSGYTLANVPTTLTASSSAYDTGNLTWAANSNPASTEYYALNVTAGTNSGWSIGTSYAFTGLEGAKAYTFQVRARNGWGILTDYTGVVSTTTLPNTPASIAVTQNGTTATVSWAANGNSSAATYVVENTTAGTNSGSLSGSTFSYPFSGLSYGTPYTFRVQAFNSDGISSSYSSSVTITLAQSSTGASSQSQLAQQQAVQEQKKKEIVASFKVTQAGTTTGYTSSTAVVIESVYSSNVTEMMIANDPGFDQSVWIPIQASKNWTISAGTGVRTVYVKYRTADGTTSDVFADSITLDQNAPLMPSITTPKKDAQLLTEKPTYAGFAEAGVSVRLTISGIDDLDMVIGTPVADSTGAWSFSSALPLKTGNYIVTATAIDKAGNVSESVTIKFDVIDQSPPMAPQVQFPVHNSGIATSTIVTYGTAEPLSKIHMVRDGTITYNFVAKTDGTWLFTIPGTFSLGKHTLDFVAFDNSNNQSAKIVVLFMIDAGGMVPPVINIEPEKPVPTPESPIIKNVDPVDTQPKTPVELNKNPSIKNPVIVPITVPPVTDASSIVNSGPSGSINSNTASTEAARLPDGGVFIAALGTAVTDLLQLITSAEFAANVSQTVVAAAIQTTEAIGRVNETTKKAAKAVRQAADAPEVQTANTAVVIPTTTVAAAASVGTAVNGTQMLTYLRFLFTQPLFLLTRRRRKQWGMAYNAITRLPVDLAVVRLIDAKEKRIVQSRVTDRAGRYQFFAPQGAYIIEIAKQEFAFPALYVVGKKEDGSLADIYTGGELSITEPTAVSYNLPLDPSGVEKPTAQILKDAAKKHLARLFSASGVIITGVSFVVTPTPLVGAFLIAHIGSFFLFRRLAIGKKPKNSGVIFDTTTKLPVEKAVVRIFDTQYNKLLETQVTDSKGNYAFLVGKNEYYIMVEREGYAPFTSKPIMIDAKEEGALLAVDVPLISGAVANVATDAHAPAIAAPIVTGVPPQYIAKSALPTSTEQSTSAAQKLLTAIDVTLPQSKELTVEPHTPEKIITYEKVTASLASIASKTIDQRTPVGTGTGIAQRLLGPVSSGTRDMIILGIPNSFQEKIVSKVDDGNFLTGLSTPPEYKMHRTPVVDDGNFLNALHHENKK